MRQHEPVYSKGSLAPKIYITASEEERWYTGDAGDHIDMALAEEINRRRERPLMNFEREAPGVYYYGL